MAGCLGPSGPAPGADGTDDDARAAAFEPEGHLFSGTFLAGGVDEPQTFTFDVPEGAGEVEALLMWSTPRADLGFTLHGPDGEAQASGWGESDRHRYVTTTAPPDAGTWTAKVTAALGIDVDYDLEVTVRTAEPYGPIDVTYEVPAQDFVEINLNMMPNDTFDYAWTSDADLYFNVHFHGNDGTERPIEHTGTRSEGNFTAPANEVYSLLFRNEGVTPVALEVSVDGTYRLHSMTRDAPGS